MINPTDFDAVNEWIEKCEEERQGPSLNVDNLIEYDWPQALNFLRIYGELVEACLERKIIHDEVWNENGQLRQPELGYKKTELRVSEAEGRIEELTEALKMLGKEWPKEG